jgi:hypothetical protein
MSLKVLDIGCSLKEPSTLTISGGVLIKLKVFYFDLHNDIFIYDIMTRFLMEHIDIITKIFETKFYGF